MKNLICLLTLALAAQPAFAQDTYNFYFQKTDHTNEMVQVKNGDPLSATKVAVPATADSTTPAAVTTAPTLAAPSALATNVATQPQPASIFTQKNYWQLETGLADFSDHVHSVNQAGHLRLQYNWNKYFGVEAQLIGGRASYSYEGDPDRSLSFAGALGLVVEPIHIDLFGWDLIDLGAGGGVMSTVGQEENKSSKQFGAAPYVGGNVVLNFSERLSARMDVKFENMNTYYGQMTAGLGYKF